MVNELNKAFQIDGVCLLMFVYDTAILEREKTLKDDIDFRRRLVTPETTTPPTVFRTMTSEEQSQNSILMTSPYPGLASA